MPQPVPAVLTDKAIAVVDVEGNGQRTPEIVEIAILTVADPRGDNVTDSVRPEDIAAWLVRPIEPISPVVTKKVHGISNRDVQNSPSWASIAPDVAETLHGRILVAQNASVETQILASHLPDWQPSLVLDTMRLAKSVWPGLDGGYGLDHLVAHARLKTGMTARHRAVADTWATALLFFTLVDHSQLSWDDLVSRAELPGTRTQEGLW